MATMSEGLTPVQRFWRLLKPDAKEIRDVYTYAVFSGLVSLSLPLGIQAIVNFIQGGDVSTSWIVMVVVVVLGVAITGVLQIFQLRITENLQQKIFTRAAFEFAYRVPRIRMENLYRHYAPELMNRFFDTLSVQKGLSKILLDFSVATLQVIFGLILLSLYHPFFILFSAVLVVLVYLIFRFTARRGLETSLQESKYKYQLAHWLEELARSSTTFRLVGSTPLPLDKTDRNVGNYLNARESHFKILVQQYSLMVIFKVIVAAGLLAIGGALVMSQSMNIGQFIAAEIIILLVMSSVEKLILSFETIYDVLTALAKIGQVTDLELEHDEGLDLKVECSEGGLAVQLKEVSFTYPEGSRKVLNKLNLTVARGEKLLIAGQNGSGKSTLLQILAGLYEIQEGQIIYNGLPKGNLKLSTVREVIGDILSQQDLFEGTLLENITMGKEHVTFDRVKWAVSHTGLATFIEELPDGYNTLLGPLGSKLPRSIVQKLLLARAIAGNPKIILLEDAFEHIDYDERKRIIEFITDKQHEWTLIAISSDPLVAEATDNVAIMEDGRITQRGGFRLFNTLMKDHA